VVAVNVICFADPAETIGHSGQIAYSKRALGNVFFFFLEGSKAWRHRLFAVAPSTQTGNSSNTGSSRQNNNASRSHNASETKDGREPKSEGTTPLMASLTPEREK
jgi:hypothetical protein